ARAVKVVNLKLERWRSIYGLRAVSAFLRVEVLDFRDVEPVAAALQRGEVSILGSPQAHEAHLPYQLQFLAEHHLSGAGLIRACGTERASRQSCCAVELDIAGPEGLLNSAEYHETLRRAGNSSEARALASLRSQLRAEGPGTVASHSDRPVPGARTPLVLRRAIQRWLQGGAAPAGEAAAALEQRAFEQAAAWQRAQELKDIEDLAGPAKG
ncbi:unnamed protein product, partial [Effrenium voratum]